ncbi:MAG: hypothetical protein LKE40_15735 [Spirochaetia bacterium]|jgi:hypothetical protein|nr:hypothetical protein [Spirochaetia bacterium]
MKKKSIIIFLLCAVAIAQAFCADLSSTGYGNTAEDAERKALQNLYSQIRPDITVTPENEVALKNELVGINITNSWSSKEEKDKGSHVSKVIFYDTALSHYLDQIETCLTDLSNLQKRYISGQDTNTSIKLSIIQSGIDRYDKLVNAQFIALALGARLSQIKHSGIPEMAWIFEKEKLLIDHNNELLQTRADLKVSGTPALNDEINENTKELNNLTSKKEAVRSAQKYLAGKESEALVASALSMRENITLRDNSSVQEYLIYLANLDTSWQNLSANTDAMRKHIETSIRKKDAMQGTLEDKAFDMIGYLLSDMEGTNPTQQAQEARKTEKAKMTKERDAIYEYRLTAFDAVIKKTYIDYTEQAIDAFRHIYDAVEAKHTFFRTGFNCSNVSYSPIDFGWKGTYDFHMLGNHLSYSFTLPLKAISSQKYPDDMSTLSTAGMQVYEADVKALQQSIFYDHTFLSVWLLLKGHINSNLKALAIESAQFNLLRNDHQTKVAVEVTPINTAMNFSFKHLFVYPEGIASSPLDLPLNSVNKKFYQMKQQEAVVKNTEKGTPPVKSEAQSTQTSTEPKNPEKSKKEPSNLQRFLLPSDTTISAMVGYSLIPLSTIPEATSYSSSDYYCKPFSIGGIVERFSRKQCSLYFAGSYEYMDTSIIKKMLTIRR